LTTKSIPLLTASLQTRQVRIVGRHCTAVILVLISGDAIAQIPLARRDPVLDQEKAIALQVEDRAHIVNIELQTKVPGIRIDAGPSLSFYGMGKGNVVHEEHWENVPASFNQRAAYSADEPTGEALFEDRFYRFFFVHELGHWMQDEVLRQRKDPMARQADRNSETGLNVRAKAEQIVHIHDRNLHSE
jgi:hypothetical protein